MKLTQILIKFPSFFGTQKFITVFTTVCHTADEKTKHSELNRRKHYSKLIYLHSFRSRDSVIGIVTGYGLDDRGVGVRVPVVSLSLLHVVHTGSAFHQTSYTIGTGGSFLGGKSGRGVKLTPHLQLVPRLTKC
jgi:hypothetical protein